VHTICFTEQEMAAFADASGDVNPIHMNKAASGADPFEAPVVYGVLGVLASLGKVNLSPGRVVRVIDATFNHAMLVDNAYQVAVSEHRDLDATITISDSDICLCTVRASYVEGPNPSVQVAQGTGRSEEPLVLSRSPVEPLEAVAGQYGGSIDSTRWLERRFYVQQALGGYAMHVLLCLSYLIGMRLPGVGGTLSRLRVVFPKIDDSDHPKSGERSLSYVASVAELNADLGEMTVSGVIDHSEQRVAMFTCEAHLSGGSPSNDYQLIEQRLGVSDNLKDRVAVVVGASRGLGAALAQGMASQGCHVYACSRTGDGPEGGPTWNGSVEHVRGECSDPEFCRRLLAHILRRHDGVHFLLCCAAPRVNAIGFEIQSMGRFNHFIRRSVELVTVPTAAFIRSVDEQGGSYLIVSSSALATMPLEWGHYVAAKAACEAVVVWAAKRFANVEMVVARVPRIGRGWSGAATGRDDMMAPEDVATLLVNRLAERVAAGVHIVEW
jgi:NAD(P)-dependent dehydrogenase (short-subunit alcohol dehydrogenase family)